MPCDLFEKHRDVLFDWASQPINLWNGRQREKEEQGCHTTAVSSGLFLIGLIHWQTPQFNWIIFKHTICIFPDDINSDLLMYIIISMCHESSTILGQKHYFTSVICFQDLAKQWTGHCFAIQNTEEKWEKLGAFILSKLFICRKEMEWNANRWNCWTQRKMKSLGP